MKGRYSLGLGLRQFAQLYRYHKRGTREFAALAVEAFRTTSAALEQLLERSIRDLKVLEIGSGQRYQNVMLFSGAGADITGIDLEEVGPGWGKYWRMLKSDGPGRVLKSLGRALLFDEDYRRALEESWGAPLPRSRLKLRACNAAAMPFAENSFDAVVSTAVFEHIDDIRGTVKEVARVLRPGGVCRVAIHLFSSLSGGHHLDWQSPKKADPPRTPAWDHLLDNRFPSHVFLNRLTKDDYLTAFEETMEVEAVEVSRSGEEWLTDEILTRAFAKGYDRDALLETELLIVARPRKGRR